MKPEKKNMNPLKEAFDSYSSKSRYLNVEDTLRELQETVTHLETKLERTRLALERERAQLEKLEREVGRIADVRSVRGRSGYLKVPKFAPQKCDR